MRRILSGLFVISMISSGVFATPDKVSNRKKMLSAIRTAPSAPAFSDQERQTELAARRSRVLDAMKDNSIMVLMSTTPRIYTNDVDFMYRQENNLFYLTNLKQNNATLVLIKSGDTRTEAVFIPKRNPQFETWNGRMYSNEDATRISGIKTILDSKDFSKFLAMLRAGARYSSPDGQFSLPDSIENLYLLTPETRFDMNDTREFQKEWDLARELSKATPDMNTGVVKYEKTGALQVITAHPIFEKLRLVKSPYEVRIMQHAIDISIEAHLRAQATVKQVRWEYETQAEIEYVFRRRNADYWGYPSIVGCGPNATTLHYVESQGEIKPGNLFLIDVGAEFDHYTADITRTFPVNGKFTKEQAEIYQIVYDAQEAAAKTMKPGGKFGDPGIAARKTVEAGLIKLGLVTGPDALIPGTERDVPDGKGGTRRIGTPQSFLWFMHGLGHWLGMNVHDVGGGAPTEFEPGMIMTNEPGIYIREDALDYFDMSKPEIRAFVEKIRPAFEKYKNIGVRIEDDMLITENGVEWMSKELPRTIEEIEHFMKKASGTIRVGAVRNDGTPTRQFVAQTGNLLDVGVDDHRIFHSPARTQTVRYGWTFTGKDVTNSHHGHDDHAE